MIVVMMTGHVFFFQIPLPSRPPWWELFDGKIEDIEVSL